MLQWLIAHIMYNFQKNTIPSCEYLRTLSFNCGLLNVSND